MAEADRSCEFVPVSLGQTCETRFQLIRHFYFRLIPEGAYDAFRACVFDPANAELDFETLIFDWQITQIFAVSYYLESDFSGIFEREDLAVTGDSNHLANLRHLTTHPHSLHPEGQYLTEAELDRGYAEARAKIEHLADKFRRQLRAPEPRLYIFNQIADLTNADRLLRALRARASHPFRVLFVGSDDRHAQALETCPDVDVRLLPKTVNKPAGQEWEGDDDAWEAVLSEFRLVAPPYKRRVDFAQASAG